MTISEILSEAQSLYYLHQMTELPLCMEWLSKKQLTGFIEVGSANGASFHCWARLIPNGPKVSVDWNRGFGMSPDGMQQLIAYETEFATVQKRNALWREHFSDVRIVEGDCLEPATVEACKTVLGGKLVDWAFIDATHEYEPGLKDTKNYSQFVKNNCYIGLHDISSHKEMTELWEDFKHNKLDIGREYSIAAEFFSGHGIGILQLR